MPARDVSGRPAVAVSEEKGGRMATILGLLVTGLGMAFVLVFFSGHRRCSVCGRRNRRTLLTGVDYRLPVYCSDECELKGEWDKLPHVPKDGGILLNPTADFDQQQEDAELRDLGFRP